MFSAVECWQLDGCVPFSVVFSQATDIVVFQLFAVIFLSVALAEWEENFEQLSPIIQHYSSQLFTKQYIFSSKINLLTAVFNNILLSHEGGQTNQLA